MDSNEEKKRMHDVFTWQIKNFSMHSIKSGESLSSPTFKAKSLDETSWYLEFNPQGNDESKDGYNSCFIHRDLFCSGPIKLKCKYLIEFIDKKGRSLMCCNKTDVFRKGDYGGFPDYMERDKLMNTPLYEDTLIIRCQLSADVPGKEFYTQNSCNTIIGIKKFSLQFGVKNSKFLPLEEVMKFIYSSTTQIKILIKIPEDDVKIYMELENLMFPCSVKCNCILLDAEGKERESKRATHQFIHPETWVFPTFIKKSELDANSDLYLKDGYFTLKFDFNISDSTTETQVRENEDFPHVGKFHAPVIDTLTVLNEDMRRLHSDKILTDVKLKVDKQTFPAHKCILSARSPVFFAMFSQDMAESQRGEVDIPDLDAKTMKLFLEYIYTGLVKDLDYKNAIKLIVAADKYQVLSLKNKCAEVLTSMLCDGNVCDVLLTADLVQHNTLKDFAFHYIKNQPDKIFSSDEWIHCVKSNLELATKTVCKVSRLYGQQLKQLFGK